MKPYRVEHTEENGAYAYQLNICGAVGRHPGKESVSAD